jgi:actin-related protein 8
MSTSYLKTELSSIWGRKAARSKTMTDEPPPEVRLGQHHSAHLLHDELHHVLMCADWPRQGRRGSHVVVFHLGSRYLRVGRASDVTPVTVPNVIARKTINPPAPTFIKGIFRPGKGRARPVPPPPANSDEYAVARGSDDPVRLTHHHSRSHYTPPPPLLACVFDGALTVCSMRR